MIAFLKINRELSRIVVKISAFAETSAKQSADVNNPFKRILYLITNNATLLRSRIKKKRISRDRHDARSSLNDRETRSEALIGKSFLRST